MYYRILVKEVGTSKGSVVDKPPRELGLFSDPREVGEPGPGAGAGNPKGSVLDEPPRKPGLLSDPREGGERAFGADTTGSMLAPPCG